MKSKKNRKHFREPSPQSHIRYGDAPALFQVQFNVSKDNISCFMGPKKINRKSLKRPSLTAGRTHKSVSRSQKSCRKSQLVKNQTPEIRADVSPDIIRISSNSILSKIEERGINCAWGEGQDQNDSRFEVNQILENSSLWSAFQETTKLDKSFASTTNDYPHYYSPMWKPPSQQSFIIQPLYICGDWRTTLMIRNIPNKYTINQLAEEIDTEHSNTYDFLYLPCDIKNQCNVGYGFINFISTEFLLSFYYKFNDYIWKKYRSEKICALTYARLQGLDQLIEHFENSKALNQKDKKYRPIIKYEQIYKMVMEQQRR